MGLISRVSSRTYRNKVWPQTTKARSRSASRSSSASIALPQLTMVSWRLPPSNNTSLTGSKSTVKSVNSVPTCLSQTQEQGHRHLRDPILQEVLEISNQEVPQKEQLEGVAPCCC